MKDRDWFMRLKEMEFCYLINFKDAVWGSVQFLIDKLDLKLYILIKKILKKAG